MTTSSSSMMSVLRFWQRIRRLQPTMKFEAHPISYVGGESFPFAFADRVECVRIRSVIGSTRTLSSSRQTTVTISVLARVDRETGQHSSAATVGVVT